MRKDWKSTHLTAASANGNWGNAFFQAPVDGFVVGLQLSGFKNYTGGAGATPVLAVGVFQKEPTGTDFTGPTTTNEPIYAILEGIATEAAAGIEHIELDVYVVTSIKLKATQRIFLGVFTDSSVSSAVGRVVIQFEAS